MDDFNIEKDKTQLKHESWLQHGQVAGEDKEWREQLTGIGGIMAPFICIRISPPD